MRVAVLISIFIYSLMAHQNSFGVGVLLSDSPYIENNNNRVVIPFLSYQHDKAYIRGVEVGYKFHHGFSIIAQPLFLSHEISEMDSRNMTAEIGFKIGYRTEDAIIFEMKYLHDALSVYDSYHTAFKISRPYINYPFITIPFFGVEYQSREFNNYYYGVKSYERGESEYHPNGDFNSFAGFMFIYNLSDKYSISLMHKETFLGDEIVGSPIVDSRRKSFTILAFSRKF